jgi:hypothetical protein
MKKCPVDGGCIGFDSFDELEEAFNILAKGEELNGDLTVEGNSGLKFGEVKKWVRCFGLENVYFDNGFDNGFIDEFYFDLKNAKYEGNADFSRADEISIENGFLRVWFD